MCEKALDELLVAEAAIKRIIFSDPAMSAACHGLPSEFWHRDEVGKLIGFADLIDQVRGECDETRHLRLVIQKRAHERRRSNNDEFFKIETER